MLTVPTIGGESIEEYATRVFDEWKLGQKGKDNGVLVVVVPKDRKMRIEVGYGLEGTLTDCVGSRIIRNEMTPQFKAGNYDAASRTASTRSSRCSRAAPGAADAAPASSASRRRPVGVQDRQRPDMPWPMRILLGAFIFGIIGLFTFSAS